MGKPTRNEILAEYYLKAAGVAAIWIDPDGHGAQDVARLHLEPGRVAYCCARGAHFVLAYRLRMWMQEQLTVSPLPAAIGTKLEELAEEGGVGLTPHAIAIERGLAAVATVNRSLDDMKGNGELRELNQAFKEARKVEPSLRYIDYLEARKAAMLEALVRQATNSVRGLCFDWWIAHDDGWKTGCSCRLYK
jgi:hypothetical protein